MKTPKTLHLAVVLLIGGAALADNDPPRPTISEFRRGDVNVDGLIDDADVDDLWFYVQVGYWDTGDVFTNPILDLDPPCLDAADVNDDGMIDGADVFILSFAVWNDVLYKLPAPGPWCGHDPTPDRLSCVYGWCI